VARIVFFHHNLLFVVRTAAGRFLVVFFAAMAVITTFIVCRALAIVAALAVFTFTIRVIAFSHRFSPFL